MGVSLASHSADQHDAARCDWKCDAWTNLTVIRGIQHRGLSCTDTYLHAGVVVVSDGVEDLQTEEGGGQAHTSSSQLRPTVCTQWPPGMAAAYGSSADTVQQHKHIPQH